MSARRHPAARRARIACLALWATAAPALGAGALHAAPAVSPGPATTRVTYLAGGSVYLEAGRRDGLAEGDTLEVVGGGRTVSKLIVRFISTARAVCDTLSALRMPAIGDLVRYRAHEVIPAPGPAPVPEAAPSDSAGLAPGAGTVAPAGAPARRAERLRGRVGARYLTLDPRGGGGYSQPALELRLEGANVGGAPIDLGVDVRGRRTYHGTAGIADDGEARVYRLAATVHDASGRRRVTLGRQLSSELSSVSLLDGARIEYAGERWGAGVLSGAEPDPATWAVSGDILHHGAFVARRGRRGDARWSLTAGGVASFDHGQINRQFGFLQGSWLDPRYSMFISEEADLNTGWKRAFGDPVVSLTNSFVSARAQLTRELSVNAGYDNRRTVRLYRDRETPETEFDDRHRQGAWLGAAAGLLRHLRVSADGRWNNGGAGGAYHALSGGLEAYRLPVLQAGARWRSTHFDGGVSRGWMHVMGLGVRPIGQSRIELSGGVRTSTDVLSGLGTRTRWEGLDLDLNVAPRWYLSLSAQHDHGGGFDAMQWQSSLSRLF